jgi:hypothetical protein
MSIAANSFSGSPYLYDDNYGFIYLATSPTYVCHEHTTTHSLPVDRPTSFLRPLPILEEKLVPAKSLFDLPVRKAGAPLILG